jgi:hypothetical protein
LELKIHMARAFRSEVGIMRALVSAGAAWWFLAARPARGDDGKLYGRLKDNAPIRPACLIEIDKTTGMATPVGRTGYPLIGPQRGKAVSRPSLETLAGGSPRRPPASFFRLPPYKSIAKQEIAWYFDGVLRGMRDEHGALSRTAGDVSTQSIPPARSSSKTFMSEGLLAIE